MAACATRVSASFPAMATGYPQGAATLPTRLEHDHADNHQITACPPAQRARLLPGPAREHVDHRPPPPAAWTPPRPQCRRPGPCWLPHPRILKTHSRARRGAQTAGRRADLSDLARRLASCALVPRRCSAFLRVLLRLQNGFAGSGPPLDDRVGGGSAAAVPGAKRLPNQGDLRSPPQVYSGSARITESAAFRPYGCPGSTSPSVISPTRGSRAPSRRSGRLRRLHEACVERCRLGRYVSLGRS